MACQESREASVPLCHSARNAARWNSPRGVIFGVNCPSAPGCCECQPIQQSRGLPAHRTDSRFNLCGFPIVVGLLFALTGMSISLLMYCGAGITSSMRASAVQIGTMVIGCGVLPNRTHHAA